MGAVFEELIRKFAELSNETAGEHFTPREVIRLMVNLLFIEDDDGADQAGRRALASTTRRPAPAACCRSAASTWPSMNPEARLVMYGQELNPESYAICKADMLIKGQDIANIIFGNTLSNDGHRSASTSTTCFPIRRLAWSGRRSRRKSARSTSSRASTAASVPACRACQRRLAAVPACT